ncbi:Phosphate transport system permease protein PstC (TC 3.A.1.7.1) [hydrothermal vent metagenome]|uniref:Phosphate transport system permease protein PstC (TC 3.A.1.7.1) n=1 Tax=hydrothermal vent metagenome TaxID=652676 RepID=A0A3B1AGA9_9ZZZZ
MQLLNRLNFSNLSRSQIRTFKDKLTAFNMAVGGIGVIIAILLIFFYLVYIVYPLFKSANISEISQFPTNTQYGQILHLAVEEQNKIAVQYTNEGYALFFNTHTGKKIKQVSLLANHKAKVTSFKISQLVNNTVILGLSNGRAIIAKHNFKISYPDDKMHIEPEIIYPAGKNSILIDKKKQPLVDIAYQQNDEQAKIIALTKDGRLLMALLQKESSSLLEEDDEETPASFTQTIIDLPQIQGAQSILIEYQQRIAYIAKKSGEVTVIDINESDNINVIEKVNLLKDNQTLTSFSFLTGGISILVGNSNGNIAQWFPVNTDNIPQLTFIRSFNKQQNSIVAIETEQRRKGFVSATRDGQIAIFNSTAKREVLNIVIPETSIQHITLSPRADLLITANDKKITTWHIENEHPEMSWAILWEQIWYESYTEPEYIWQSSSADNDFEPKYSFMPLAFGTLKAAFYAMLFAIPLALMGAIYTAYFMAPKMRAVVKPTIEIMEALPTVILGFLAGLWLAPFLEKNLVGVFSLLIIMPIGILLFSFAWQALPKKIRMQVPDGWHAALLIPVIFFLGWAALSLSPQLENIFFDGNIQLWLKESLGMDFDQRNSLVVGIAMGVAVIPTIFSIAEDAIFSVPKHLTFGSLALGATPWQTLMRVVILTASPGIFSAVMIGMGRAVGETMIVLMATGNTPVMDFSIFQGMRTLSANIAVEMPEAEVASTHYRILFLAALVLFLFTFIFNTAAEIIRHRLRKKYSSL